MHSSTSARVSSILSSPHVNSFLVIHNAVEKWFNGIHQSPWHYTHICQAVKTQKRERCVF